MRMGWVVFLLPALGGAQDARALQRQARTFFQPLPDQPVAREDNPLTPEKILLGKMLYYDPRLSRSGLISCNTCHNLATGGVDNLPTSIGHRWQRGPRNAPTVLNAALNATQFWDGRSPDVEDQATKPIENPIEMAATESLVVARLQSIPAYVDLFRKAFPEDPRPITLRNIGKAIGAFERTLLTPSRFDRFLRGDLQALTPEELRGLQLFIAKGCVGCHNGVNVGGKQFARFQRGDDEGRAAVTGKASDRFMFRVPTLRNVALTAPYFHTGDVWSLEEAVQIMARTQLNTELKADEVQAIVAFLHALTGEVPEEARTLPTLPPSTSQTPGPEF